MAYATVANLAALGIRSETTEDIDTADLDSALASASSEADSYLGLPPSRTAAPLKRHAAGDARLPVGTPTLVNRPPNPPQLRKPPCERRQIEE